MTFHIHCDWRFLVTLGSKSSTSDRNYRLPDSSDERDDAVWMDVHELQHKVLVKIRNKNNEHFLRGHISKHNNLYNNLYNEAVTSQSTEYISTATLVPSQNHFFHSDNRQTSELFLSECSSRMGRAVQLVH